MNKRNNLKGSILLIFSLFLISSSWCQLDAMKLKAYNAKVNRSSAMELIKSTDEIILKVDKKTTYSIEKLMNDVPHYGPNYEEIVANRVEILQLDPKWKTEKIDECLQRNKAKYDEVLAYNEALAVTKTEFEELEIYFEEKKKLYSDADNDGATFYQFVTGTGEYDLNWELTQANLDKVEDLETRNKVRIQGYSGLHKTKMNHVSVFDKKELNGKKDDFMRYLKYPDYKSLNSKTKLEAYLKSIENLAYLDAYMFLLDSDQDLTDAKVKVKALHDQLDEEFNKVFSSDFHKKSINKILLSDHPIVIGTETDADFKTNFNSNEAIYVTIYLDRIIKGGATRNFKMLVGGHPIPTTFMIPYQEVKKPTKGETSVFQFTLVPEVDNALKDYRKVAIFKVINHFMELKPESNKIELIVDNVPTAKFFIDASEGVMNYTEILKEIKAANIRYTPVPKAGMTDATVLGLVKKALVVDDQKDQVFKVIILDNSWSITRSDLHNDITDRWLNTVVACCKDGQGKCYMLFGSLSQNRAGGQYLQPQFSTYKYYPVDYLITDAEPGADNDNRFYYNCSK
jgi:hypothetical protein